MSWVTLGLCPSLYAAAQRAEELPVSLAALYDKAKRTEPRVLRGLIQGNAQRLASVMDEIGYSARLADWRLRLVDGNHLPASERCLDALRDQSAAALPGQEICSKVVYGRN